MALVAMTATLDAQTYPSIHGPESTPHYPAAGSTYVPIESWVYPAIERLAALRYVRSEFRSTRPWSRTECARLTDEAGDRIQEIIRANGDVPEDVAETYKALEQEFSRELDVLGGDRNRSLQMESVYSRVMSMSGPTLDDSYNFGQTIEQRLWTSRSSRARTQFLAPPQAQHTVHFSLMWIEEYQHAPAQHLIIQLAVQNVTLSNEYRISHRFSRWAGDKSATVARHLCRDQSQELASILRSPVVMVGHQRQWPFVVQQ